MKALFQSKKITLGLLLAFSGGVMALSIQYLWASVKPDRLTSFQEKQDVYFAKNPMAKVSVSGLPDFTESAAMVTPAVVHITTTFTSPQRTMTDPFDGFFDDFFVHPRMQPRQPQEAKATGSGVLITDDGYIVTNNHVVDNADKIEVSLTDKRTFSAKVIGTDPNTDLALLKISGTNLPIVKIGNSDEVRVGEWVLAVGNPFNLHSTVTAGIVSAKARNIGIIGTEQGSTSSHPIESFIQTDAAINKGNSGGALVNTRGELIGINAAIASQSGSYEGYGFAIPINLVKKVMDDFLKFGVVKRGFLGVQISEINSEIAKEKNLNSTKGVYISKVEESSAAQNAGLKEGDVILRIEDQDVNTTPEVMEQIGRFRPGDKVNLTVNRAGKEKKFVVELKGEEEVLTYNGVGSSAEETYNKLGASFSKVPEATKKKLGINIGVLVAEVRKGKIFEQMNIQKGTVITQINNKTVDSTNDVDEAIKLCKNNMILIMGIAPSGAHITFQFPIR